MLKLIKVFCVTSEIDVRESRRYGRPEVRIEGNWNVAIWLATASASSYIPSCVAGNGSNMSLLDEDSGVGARRLSAEKERPVSWVVWA